jgi:mannose-6-phosphate isomerase-like protein (cupin superfamily)
MCKAIRAIVMIGLVALIVSTPAAAQTTAARPNQTGNDPNYGGGRNSFPGPSLIVYSPRDTQDRRIDMFLADWHESMPRVVHGSLVLRDMLKKGDYFSPPEKGAILPAENSISYATLAAHASTTPSQLSGEQEVYYFIGGGGRLTGGGTTADLHKDIAAFVPANLEFVITNTGDEPLKMYLISEPTYPGFKPIDKILVIDERQAHVRTPTKDDPYIAPGASGHWGHVVREVFAKRDGLATLSSLLTVELPPLTLGEPHPHRLGSEEVWTALEGTTLAWMGSEVRLQKPGMAYMIRPDGVSTHSNINFSDSPVKFLYFNGRRQEQGVQEVR